MHNGGATPPDGSLYSCGILCIPRTLHNEPAKYNFHIQNKVFPFKDQSLSLVHGDVFSSQ